MDRATMMVNSFEIARRRAHFGWNAHQFYIFIAKMESKMGWHAI